jgi:cysteinyl-tRNA synthetase
MEWESPWGLGFPGWHIECSAMSMKYLGESFDIHCGGEDLRQTHHPNEIAQAEGATGKTFVKYWVHTTFLKVDGKRMGRSLGNVYKVSDLEGKGFDPLALRYLLLTAHYRDTLNFTWEALKSAQTALFKLRQLTASLRGEQQRTILSPEKEGKLEGFMQAFRQALNDDLNTPKALAVTWEMLKSNIPSQDKLDALLSFDEVLGLRLSDIRLTEVKIPDKVEELVNKREELRSQGKFEEGDKIRKEVEHLGFKIEDSGQGPVVKPVQNGK